MKKYIYFILCLASIQLAQAATAIYYSPSTSYIVIRKKQKTENAAIQKAKTECEAKYDDCELLNSSEDGGYGAIAGSTKIPGFNSVLSASSKKEAEKNVLNRCNAKYGSCKIYSSFYDAVFSPPPPQPQEQICYGASGPTQCGALYSFSGRSNSTGQMINGSP
jgi:Domain of unknown function (DUF4189)